MRKVPGWFPALPNRTGRLAGALTVAGQWRSFTAFPNILAIAVVGHAALKSSSRYAMEDVSVTSTFIAGDALKVKIDHLSRESARFTITGLELKLFYVIDDERAGWIG